MNPVLEMRRQCRIDLAVIEMLNSGASDNPKRHSRGFWQTFHGEIYISDDCANAHPKLLEERRTNVKATE